jgi:ubiquinone/menaquinone biosynthesis C-methylase UbiE
MPNTHAVTIPIRNEDLDVVYAPYVHERMPPDHPAVRALLKRTRRDWRRRRVRAAVERWVKGRPRTPEKVKDSYEAIWGAFDYADLLPDPNRRLYAMRGADDYQMANAWGVPRVHLHCLKTVIETLKPKTVLEVGCGRGLNLLALAARFPEIRFAGLELSEAGVREARATAEAGALPPALVEFAPFDLVDQAAVRALDLHNGSAAEMPFEDGRFDLVYTRQALEQMEIMRDRVMREVRRVCSGYVAMFEAFRDWNTRGMKRDRAAVTQYFRARLSDLPRYGLEPVYVKDDLPHKIYMQVGLVVAKVRADRVA